jgi:hypothetical protein
MPTTINPNYEPNAATTRHLSVDAAADDNTSLVAATTRWSSAALADELA